MRSLLFLAHRIPYPPDKGDKIRAWNTLLHLARSHRVYLGCLADDPSDLAHVGHLRTVCADVQCAVVSRRGQMLRALAGLRPGRPLTLDFFHDRSLDAWVGRTLPSMDRAFVFCSAMAPYLMAPERLRAAPGGRVLDLVDIDSDKWAQYAARAHGPRRLVWAREARTLLPFEARAAQAFDRALFVSPAEAAHFRSLAPTAGPRVDWVEMGVDTEAFAPDPGLPDPYPPGGPVLLFTGTMDYWPNEEAVAWMAQDILPRLRGRADAPRFWIVGARPTPAVRRLGALPGVTVTGRVPDVRPYLAHAAACVAPLRIARGIQSKVLEAMAMARPVVASVPAFEGVRAEPGRELLVAADAAHTAAVIAEVLDGRHSGMGDSARAAILERYRWGATLSRLDTMFDATDDQAAPADELTGHTLARTRSEAPA